MNSEKVEDKAWFEGKPHLPDKPPVDGEDCPSRADVNYRCVVPAVERSVRDMSGSSSAGKHPFMRHLETVMETHTDDKDVADDAKKFRIGKFVILGFGNRGYVTDVIKWLRGLGYNDKDIKRTLVVFDFSPQCVVDLLSSVETRAVFDGEQNIFIFDPDDQDGMVKTVNEEGVLLLFSSKKLKVLSQEIRDQSGLCVAHLVGHVWPMIYRPEQVESALRFFGGGGFDILGIDLAESWDGIIRKLDAGHVEVFQPWVSMGANAKTLVYKSGNKSASPTSQINPKPCPFKKEKSEFGKNYCPKLCYDRIEGQEDNVVLGLLTRRKKNTTAPCFLERGYGYRWVSKSGSSSCGHNDFAFIQKYFERMISSADVVNELHEHNCYLTEKLLAPTYFGAMNLFIFSPLPSANKNLAIFSNVFASAVREEIIKPMLDMLKGHPLFRGLSQIIFYAVLPFGKDATYVRLLSTDEKLRDLSSVKDWSLLNKFSLTQSEFANAEYTKDALLGDPARVFFSVPKPDRLNACDLQMSEHEKAYSEMWRKLCFAGGTVDEAPKVENKRQMFISAVPLYSGSFPFAAIGFAVPNPVFDAVPSSSADGAAARRAVMTEGFRALMSKSGKMKSVLLKIFNDYLGERDATNGIKDGKDINVTIKKECESYLRNVRNKDWHLSDFGFGTTSLTKGISVQNEDQSMDRLWNNTLDEALADPICKGSIWLKDAGFFDGAKPGEVNPHEHITFDHIKRYERLILIGGGSYCDRTNNSLALKDSPYFNSAQTAWPNDLVLEWLLRIAKSVHDFHSANCTDSSKCGIPAKVSLCPQKELTGSDDLLFRDAVTIDFLKLKAVFCAKGENDTVELTANGSYRFSVYRILGFVEMFSVHGPNENRTQTWKLGKDNVSSVVGDSLCKARLFVLDKECKFLLNDDKSTDMCELFRSTLPFAETIKSVYLDANITKSSVASDSADVAFALFIAVGNCTGTSGQSSARLPRWLREHDFKNVDSIMKAFFNDSPKMMKICFALSLPGTWMKDDDTGKENFTVTNSRKGSWLSLDAPQITKICETQE